MLRLICFLICFPLLIAAEETICLNMIVKNEAHIIRRCLDTVKDHIDFWVIVDTGSTDGTQEIIQTHLKDVPGILYERPWINFGHNRSEALELAKAHGDYILFIDADDILEFEPGTTFPALTEDLYYMWRGNPGFTYMKEQIVRSHLPWKWIGVTHEYIGTDCFFTSGVLENVRYITVSDGASRQDPSKFYKNVKLLEDGLIEEPQNERYAFYLAESYYDAGEAGKALECYQRRVKMGGWPEEVYWSKLRIAHLIRNMGLSSEAIIASYMDAHAFRPHRTEAVYYLAEYYNQIGNYKKAYALIKAQSLVETPYTRDYLFNEDWIDDYGLRFQLSICSYYVGNYQESLDLCDELLAMDNLPAGWRNLTESNRTFPLHILESKREYIRPRIER